MSYDRGTVARVQDALGQLGERAVREKNVFGGRGFLSGKTTFLIVYDDSLIIKVPRSEYEQAIAGKGVDPFAPDGAKPMSTWVVVASDLFADDPELQEWVGTGLRGIR